MRQQQSELMDGDQGWMGINSRLDPASLKPGFATDAENARFRNGVAESRLGVVKPACFNNTNPALYGSEIRSWGTIYGVGVFRDPDSMEYLLIAAGGNVYYSRQGNLPRQITLPTGVKVLSECTFTQAFDKVIMFRGDHFAPLVMADLGTGFEPLIEYWDSTKSYANGDEVAFGTEKSVSSLTISALAGAPPVGGGAAGTVYTATVVTTSNHEYKTGTDVIISGANEANANGTWNVTVVDNTTFKYTLDAAGAVGADSGTIKCRSNSTDPDYWQVVDAGGTSAGESPLTHSAKWAQQSDIMPNADSGIYVQNRLAVATNFDTSTLAYTAKKDRCFFSDILDLKHTFFSQQLRINQGDDSVLVDLVRMNENQVLCFKDKNVSILTGIVVGDGNALGASISLQTLINNYGLAARGAAVMVGTDCYFYAGGRRGVVSITQTEQNKARGVDIPISEPIQTIIDQVDPRHEDKVRIALWDSKLFVALPIGGGSTGCNSIAVFDFLNQAWSGVDKGAAIKPKEFFLATWNGSQRLFFTDSDGYINLVGEKHEGDEVGDSSRLNGIGVDPVSFSLTTRGYSNPDLFHRFFRTARVNISTNDPQYTIQLITDGVNESQTLVENHTKDRTQYYRPFDASPWLEDNALDDHGTAYRQDYSVLVPGDTGAVGVLTEEGYNLQQEDGSPMLTEGSVTAINIGSGFAPWKMQETLEPFTISSREGRFGQIKITNSRGRMKVKGAVLTTASGSRTISAKA